MPHIAKETINKKIKGRIISAEKLRGESFTKLKNFNIKYIEEITPSSTMVFGNLVSIQIFDEKISIILIESQELADSYRNNFNQLWKIAKK